MSISTWLELGDRDDTALGRGGGGCRRATCHVLKQVSDILPVIYHNIRTLRHFGTYGDLGTQLRPGVLAGDAAVDHLLWSTRRRGPDTIGDCHFSWRTGCSRDGGVCLAGPLRASSLLGRGAPPTTRIHCYSAHSPSFGGRPECGHARSRRTRSRSSAWLRREHIRRTADARRWQGLSPWLVRVCLPAHRWHHWRGIRSLPGAGRRRTEEELLARAKDNHRLRLSRG